MKAYLLSALIFLLATSPLYAQRRLTERLLSNEGDTSKRGSFLVLPALAYAQETGWAFGLVSLSSFYYNKKDTTTRPSIMSGVAAVTTKKQWQLSFKPDIWTAGNKYHYLGELRYKNFPFNYYGVGDRTLAANKDIITQKLIKISAEVEKKLSRGIYVGLTSSYENYKFTDKEIGGIYETDLLTRNRDGGQVFYFGVSQIIDTRNSNNYPTKGTYLKLNYSYAPDFFGGDDFTGSTFKIDFRNFKSFSDKTVFGMNLNYQSLLGSSSPFYLLPQLGNDQMMRGYYTGRYRGQDLLAAQAELRYRLIPRFGLAAFAGAGSVYSRGAFSFDRLKPSYGAGARYFVDPKRGTTLRFDYAFGEKRDNEKRQKGFYLSVSEAF